MMKKNSILILIFFLSTTYIMLAQEQENKKVSLDGSSINYFENDLPYTAKANKEFQFLAFFYHSRSKFKLLSRK